MLTDGQKKKIEEQMLPVIDGWQINDVFDALEYAKGYISDFATLKLPPLKGYISDIATPKLPPFQAGKESSDKC